ncbi:hypothetical protein [Streptomyces sp. bgisy034]|uniref:hypothetical protein n=1 Tax=Streptomyces sp. bgisy034 TaxID=3413774 RepID=UPI003EB8B132
MSDPGTQPRRALCGYLRRLPGVDHQVEQRLTADLRIFAETRGFTLNLVFIEKEPGRTAALTAVTRYCQRHGIRDVVVPTAEHLNYLPSLAYLAKELLQQDICGRVWIAADIEEELSCPPTSRRDGGSP